MGKSLQPGSTKVGTEKGRPKRNFSRNRSGERSKLNYEAPAKRRGSPRVTVPPLLSRGMFNVKAR